eukprot:CAMPEP_0206005624 /NCGR_PEP_ID=MMETSP1464-20131121/4680_1 /ASSEMBLY_ACC=CAM_ASM_001124 /TAXON_ID=119497 /ORGANISM="Exanthemachrysis gayraliae, Strain RCC1523" /LENGTH=325 /DNA_ID=CAMNT_0053379071 /DNA_START=489 /DNA_END=1463 /DNA_ORIENTATION=+
MRGIQLELVQLLRIQASSRQRLNRATPPRVRGAERLRPHHKRACASCAAFTICNPPGHWRPRSADICRARYSPPPSALRVETCMLSTRSPPCPPVAVATRKRRAAPGRLQAHRCAPLPRGMHRSHAAMLPARARAGCLPSHARHAVVGQPAGHASARRGCGVSRAERSLHCVGAPAHAHERIAARALGPWALEAVRLNLVLGRELVLDEELADVLALVALELEHLAHGLVIDDVAIAAVFLLDHFEHLLQVERCIKALHRGDALAAVSLLHADVDVASLADGIVLNGIERIESNGPREVLDVHARGAGGWRRPRAGACMNIENLA